MNNYYEIRVVDGGRVVIDLDKVSVVLLPNQFGPTPVNAQVTVGTVNIQMSFADATDLVERLKKDYEYHTHGKS